MLRGHVERHEETFRHEDVLHFANGMVGFASEPPRLRPFSPDYYSTNATPFPYEPTATCPRFTSMMHDAVGKDDTDLILNWLGMALTGRNFAQKILLLTGIGGAGKGVLVHIISALIGRENCEQLRTSQLNQRFELSRFVDRTLLIGADVPGDFLNLAGAQTLKALTGGDLLSVESKNANGSGQIIGDFNVVITSNQTLRVKLDGDHQAWRRRLLIVEFTKPVARVNPRFAEEIIAAEASGIINAALAGLQRVRADFVERGEFRLSAGQRERIERLIDESDSLRSFLRETVGLDAKHDVTTEELHHGYQHYCSERGWIEQPAAVFRNQVPQLMFEFFRVRSRNDIDRGTNRRGYSGVALRGDQWGSSETD